MTKANTKLTCKYKQYSYHYTRVRVCWSIQYLYQCFTELTPLGIQQASKQPHTQTSKQEHNKFFNVNRKLFNVNNHNPLQQQLLIMLTLQFQQIRPFLIDIWSFSSQNLVETLTLQTTRSNSKVHKRDTWTQIRRKLNLSKTQSLTDFNTNA